MIEKNGEDLKITIQKRIRLRLKIKLAHYCTNPAKAGDGLEPTFMQSRLKLIYKNEYKKSSNSFEVRIEPVNRNAVDLKI